MNKASTCCFTGHRDLPPSQLQTIREALHHHILNAILNGYRHFLCGMANGADLLFAQVVAELKQQYPITLEAALPYQARMRSGNPAFQQLLAACDVVKAHSPAYHGGCYQKRNRYMVDNASCIIAVYNGEAHGGTYATLQYARQQGLSVIIIPATK